MVIGGSICGPPMTSAGSSARTWSTRPRFSMPPDDRIRVLHMIEAAETAQAFIVGRQSGDLATDRMLLLALERSIEIVGEAAARISVDTKDAAPAVPWAQIA